MFNTGKSNAEILKLLNEDAYGHTNVKKALINLVNRSRLRHYQKWIERLPKKMWIPSGKCLILGQSGTGKTHIVECLSQIVDFPLIRIDATQLNPTGASGGIKSEGLQDKIVSLAKSLSKSRAGYYNSVEGTIDQTVVFIDEIDKLGGSFEGTSNAWNKHVQSSFLTMFDNKSIYSGVSFIFAGAFSELTKNVKKSNPIGFSTAKEEVKERDLAEEITKYGLIPEIVGRLTQIEQLDIFTEKDYLNILRDRVLPKKKIDMACFGIFNIKLTTAEMKRMSAKAHKSGQGVRALSREIDAHFVNREFDFEKESNGLTLLSHWGKEEAEEIE